MSSILNLIEGYMSGNAWEDLCVQCYHLRYQKDNYIEIPATHGGDAGIEGFTNKGIVHQCYCPEREYSDQDLYSHLRTKLTEDIDKLKNNGAKLRSLGVPPVVEWQFNIPDYRDSRILAHVEKKTQEIRRLKKSDPNNYQHIANDFCIVIKTAEDFAPEISRIVRTNLTDLRLNLAFNHNEEIDWSTCDSEKVANIRRKIKVVVSSENGEVIDRLVSIYVNCYLSGIEVMNTLRVNFPEVYRDIFLLEQSYKRDVTIRTLMNTDNKMNKSLFNSILDDFHAKLERDFSKSFTEATIGELKQDLVASWLADCSMEFRSE